MLHARVTAHVVVTHSPLHAPTDAAGVPAPAERAYLMRLSLRPTHLLCLLSGVVLLSGSLQAQTAIDYTFEDRRLRGDPTAMVVAPKIITSLGNSYMRITGSAADKENIPVTQPDRNRSTVEFTQNAKVMPYLTDVNRRQTYSAKLRFSSNTGSNGVIFEMFQSAPNSGTYGTRDSNGPVFICWRVTGQVSCRANYDNETRWTAVNLGRIAAGVWQTFRLNAVWSHDPRVGRLELLVNGTRRLLVTGRGTNLGPQAKKLPMMKLGLYGDHALGHLDVDSLSVASWPVLASR